MRKEKRIFESNIYYITIGTFIVFLIAIFIFSNIDRWTKPYKLLVFDSSSSNLEWAYKSGKVRLISYESGTFSNKYSKYKAKYVLIKERRKLDRRFNTEPIELIEVYKTDDVEQLRTFLFE